MAAAVWMNCLRLCPVGPLRHMSEGRTHRCGGSVCRGTPTLQQVGYFDLCTLLGPIQTLSRRSSGAEVSRYGFIRR